MIISTGMAYAPVSEKKSKKKLIIIGAIVGVALVGIILFLVLFLVPNITGAEPEKVSELFTEHIDDVQHLEEVFETASKEGLTVGDLFDEDEYVRLTGGLASVRSLCDEICGYSTIKFDSEAGDVFMDARNALKERLPQYEKAMETYVKFYEAYGKDGNANLQKSLLGSSDAEVKALAERFEGFYTGRKNAISNLEKNDCYTGSNGSVSPCSTYFNLIANSNSFLSDGSVMKEMFAAESDIAIDYAGGGYIYAYMRDTLEVLESE